MLEAIVCGVIILVAGGTGFTAGFNEGWRKCNDELGSELRNAQKLLDALERIVEAEPEESEASPTP